MTQRWCPVCRLKTLLGWIDRTKMRFVKCGENSPNRARRLCAESRMMAGPRYTCVCVCVCLYVFGECSVRNEEKEVLRTQIAAC